MWPFGSSEPSPLDDQIISGTFPNVLKGCENQVSSFDLYATYRPTWRLVGPKYRCST